MNEEEKILSGKLYTPGAPELVSLKLKAHNLSVDYNKLHEDEMDKRKEILKELFPDMGDGVFFQGPINIHYGVHTHIGENCFFNFNTTRVSPFGRVSSVYACIIKATKARSNPIAVSTTNGMNFLLPSITSV